MSKFSRREFMGMAVGAGAFAGAAYVAFQFDEHGDHGDPTVTAALAHEPDDLSGGYDEALKDPPSSIDPSSGWLDWCIESPGPAHKVNPGVNGLLGIAGHSAEGYAAGLESVLFGPRAASWNFQNMQNGDMVQRYSVYTRTWTSGSAFPNNNFIGVENEGVIGQPLNEAQIKNLQRLARDMERLTGRKFVRLGSTQTTIPSGQLVLAEHKDCTRWGSLATSCPSGRIDWNAVLAGIEETPPFEFSREQGLWAINALGWFYGLRLFDSNVSIRDLHGFDKAVLREMTKNFSKIHVTYSREQGLWAIQALAFAYGMDVWDGDKNPIEYLSIYDQAVVSDLVRRLDQAVLLP